MRDSKLRLSSRTALLAAGSAAILILAAAVMEFNVERAAAKANIITFSDALWWAVSTVTTVGGTLPHETRKASALLGVNGRSRPERIAWHLFGPRKGEAMADIETWLADVAGALGVPLEAVLPGALRSELLDLTGDIAHNVVRLAVPLTSYLMGVAVGRGASAEDALRIVGDLVPKADR